MEQWIQKQDVVGQVPGVGLLVCLVVLLVSVPPWVMAYILWRKNQKLNAELREGVKSHTNDLLMQSERFGQQYYSQGERSSLVLSDSLKRVTDSFANAVSGMQGD